MSAVVALALAAGLLLAQPARYERWVTLGDSLTCCPIDTTNWPAELRTLKGGEFPSGTLRIANVAVSGATTATVLASQWNGGGANTTDVARIVVLAGINDITSGVALATIEANLQTIYDAAVARGIMVTPVSVTPFGAASGWTQAKQDKADALWVWQLAWCVTNGQICYDARPCLWDSGTPVNLLPAYDSGDGYHYSHAGSTALATCIKNALAP